MLSPMMWKILAIALGKISVIFLGQDTLGHLGGDVYMQLVYKSGVGMRVCTEDTHERVITLELTMSHETA